MEKNEILKVIQDFFNPTIGIKLLNEEAKMPVMSTSYSAYDVFSCKEYVIAPNSWQIIKTGIAIDMPKDYELQIRSRSGMAAKNGVFVLNSPGTIDADYKSLDGLDNHNYEIKIMLFNASQFPFEVNKGDRVAQMRFCPVSYCNLIEIPEHQTLYKFNHDRMGGLGSTGV